MVEIEISDNAGDFGIALVGRLAVFVEVQGRIQSFDRHVGDGVGLGQHVVPEFFRGVGIRVDAAHANNGNFIFDFMAGAGEDFQGVELPV